MTSQSLHLDFETKYWEATDFEFHTGHVLRRLRIHYATIGNPSGKPVLILHGTTGSLKTLQTPKFAGELFGPGQPLDAREHFIVLPDSIGHGYSSKPSDGLRMAFPKYNYDDAVTAQYRLATEALGVDRFSLVLGNSMGGMHAWLWAIRYPKALDAAVAMACMPARISGRNWMTRRMIVEMIMRDPAWNEGNYIHQPKAAQLAMIFYRISMNGGDLGLHQIAPTRELADQYLERELGSEMAFDANDLIYQWNSSRDYDPEPHLADIQVPVLQINSEDDERYPPELSDLVGGMAKMRDVTYFLIPQSAATAGHSTTADAKLWKGELTRWLASHGAETKSC